ncbi:glycoside hydrolase family 113 [Burkholderia anthina]|uniref:glycoside hydrolase family 113 n=1 Tax=Burkholderia anthina TaxID=179879 RepID=UPI00158B4913|nr:glycosidase-like protein [Burkholderia anthina]
MDCDLAPMHGFNLIQDRQAPFGSAQAFESMSRMRRTGANTVALVPFLWQRKPDAPDIARGDDMSDEQLAQGIRAAHRLGLTVFVKPQVWVPGTWAGAVRMSREADWNTWFARYERALIGLAAVAAREHAEGFVLGTELDQTAAHPTWLALIAHVRAVFHGKVSYVAHNVDGAEQVPFWQRLDAVGVTLYPSLVADDKPPEWARVMQETSMRLQSLSRLAGRPVFVAEIGLRSAAGATAKPWESAEEHVANVNEALQADVLRGWIDTLKEPTVQTVLVWRWISAPDSGGHADTDFTVQGKISESMLSSRWVHCQAEGHRVDH